MAIIINYKGTTRKSTEWERHERYNRFIELQNQLHKIHSKEDISKLENDGYYIILNGDSDVLDFAIERLDTSIR